MVRSLERFAEHRAWGMSALIAPRSRTTHQVLILRFSGFNLKASIDLFNEWNSLHHQGET